MSQSQLCITVLAVGNVVMFCMILRLEFALNRLKKHFVYTRMLLDQALEGLKMTSYGFGGLEGSSSMARFYHQIKKLMLEKGIPDV